MGKIKLTTIRDGIKEDEILSRLKAAGVKIKTPEKVETEPPKPKREGPPSSDVVEKRVASVVIRRRLRPVEKEVEEKRGEPERLPEERVKAEALEGRKVVEEKKEKIEFVERREERIVFTEIEPAKEDIPVAEEPKPEEVKVEKESEEVKGGELITEEEEKQITKALEEWYGEELEREVILYDEDEEKRMKKAEKLLRRLEEQELEETRFKKKAKRKVVITEEEVRVARKQRAKVFPFRKEKREKKEGEERPKEEPRPLRKVIKIGEEIQVLELAKRLGVKASELLSKLISLGIMVNVTQSIDFDTAYLVASEYGCEVEKILSIEEEFQAREEERKEEGEPKPRPPIVTIMGHVDHGKTLLLDTIRHTHVAEEEAGGITQHIGAYVVNINGKDIVFIDTPGHEAFTAMRARGAQVTDIVVLVVAADDGVMPQTIEAINHARAANVPIIVAINKIDKENANPDKVMKDLAELGLIPEEWGGGTLFAKISAKKRIGIEELLDLILLQAEMMELKADPERLARGIVIESKLDKGHGPCGTVIVQEGTLKIGDPFICGTTFGRVRAMIDYRGKKIERATPSMPVLVVGFQDLPEGGDRLAVTSEERYAKELSKYRLERLKEREGAAVSRMSLDKLYEKMGEKGKVTLNLIIKADVKGTIDAINEALKKLENDKVDIHVVHSGVGAITETDVNLAIATGGIIVGFNTRPVSKAKVLAEKEKVEIRTYSVIYDLVEDVRKAMEGLLEPILVERPIGRAEIRKVFIISKMGPVAGCYVTEGKVTRGALVRIRRNGNVLFEGKVGSLKRFKEDVKEVMAGYECGIGIEQCQDMREGDVLEFYVVETQKQTLGTTLS